MESNNPHNTRGKSKNKEKSVNEKEIKSNENKGKNTEKRIESQSIGQETQENNNEQEKQVTAELIRLENNMEHLEQSINENQQKLTMDFRKSLQDGLLHCERICQQAIEQAYQYTKQTDENIHALMANNNSIMANNNSALDELRKSILTLTVNMAETKKKMEKVEEKNKEEQSKEEREAAEHYKAEYYKTKDVKDREEYYKPRNFKAAPLKQFSGKNCSYSHSLSFFSTLEGQAREISTSYGIPAAVAHIKSFLTEGAFLHCAMIEEQHDVYEIGIVGFLEKVKERYVKETGRRKDVLQRVRNFQFMTSKSAKENLERFQEGVDESIARYCNAQNIPILEEEFPYWEDIIEMMLHSMPNTIRKELKTICAFISQGTEEGTCKFYKRLRSSAERLLEEEKKEETYGILERAKRFVGVNAIIDSHEDLYSEVEVCAIRANTPWVDWEAPLHVTDPNHRCFIHCIHMRQGDSKIHANSNCFLQHPELRPLNFRGGERK